MKYIRTLFLLLLVALAASGAKAQLTPAYNVPVATSEGELRFAWAGGFNNPQFSPIDLNDDGIDDLFVFDRADETAHAFVFTGEGKTPWRYAPEYLNNFPVSELNGWALLRDFNADGRPDIFTGAAPEVFGLENPRVAVWEQIAEPNGAFPFKLKHAELPFYEEDDSGAFVYAGDLTAGSSGVPGIADIDYDGDLDFLREKNSGRGSGQLIYYRNEAVERLNRSDTFLLRIASFCWGRFEENYEAIADSYRVNLGLPPCPGEIGKTSEVSHAGGLVLPLQLNGDSLMDVLISDADADYIIALFNGGDRRVANITAQETGFPRNDQSVRLEVVPAGFLADADGDGVSDLIAAPHMKYVSRDQNCALRYKNFGTETKPDFRLQESAFLQAEMIDLGSETQPFLSDYDGDGLRDLFVAYRSRQTAPGVYTSNIALFKNEGTAKAPAFRLIADPLLPEQPWFRDLSGAAADLDGDGLPEVITGALDGTLALWKNYGSVELPDFRLETTAFAKGISETERRLAPALFDYENNGKPDLLLGTARGKVLFLENRNRGYPPEFQLIDESFGGIDVTDSISPFVGNATPALADLDGDGRQELLIGTTSGRLRVFDVCGAEQSKFPERQAFDLPETGENAAAAVLTGLENGEILLATGTPRGGMHLHRGKFAVEEQPGCAPPEPKAPSGGFSLYPVPAGDEIVLETKAGGSVAIYGMDGKKILNKTIPEAGSIVISVANLPNGAYLCTYKSHNDLFTKKFTLAR